MNQAFIKRAYIAVSALLFLFTVTFYSASSFSEADISPYELFSKRESRVNQIPKDWAVTNPIRVNVCFNLKHAINSDEANDFLDNLYATINGFDFDVTIQLFRTIYPVKLDYCATMTFPNWEAQREYETSDEFLSFYRERWKAVVTDTQEHWAVEDLHAGR